MGMLDDIENEGKDIMENPQTKAKVEQIAKEKGLSLEDAKKDFLQNNKQ